LYFDILIFVFCVQEKEALAIVWAMERLSIYLLGHKFELHIDNKALALILDNPLSKPPARIQRWG
jgi:hypothetical protein